MKKELYTLTITQLAKKAKSTPEAVSMAKKRGKLPQSAMFDEQDPVVIAWIEGVASRRSVRAAGLSPAKASSISTTTVSSASESMSLDRARKIADVNLKRSQAVGHEIRNAERKGLLVLKSLVVQKIAGFDAALKANFRDMPRRTADQLYALARSSDDSREMERYLEREISAALVRTKEAACRLDLLPEEKK